MFDLFVHKVVVCVCVFVSVCVFVCFNVSSTPKVIWRRGLQYYVACDNTEKLWTKTTTPCSQG